MSAHVFSLTGLPKATDWTEEFTRHLPASRSLPTAVLTQLSAGLRRILGAVVPIPASSAPALPSWFYMNAHALLDAAAAGAANADSGGGRPSSVVRQIDEQCAAVLGLAPYGLGVAELVWEMARCWVGYAQAPADPRAADDLDTARDAYDARIASLSQLWRGGA